MNNLQQSKLCQQFGLDNKKREERLILLDLQGEYESLAHRLIDKIIRPNISDIVDQFYSKLSHDPVAKTFILDQALLQRLKKTQKNYLLNLGIDYKSESYFESRLRSGLAHAWVGLPLMTYQCGYYIQSKIIIDYIRRIAEQDEINLLTDFLHKIVALDMSLATESYYGLQLKGLSQSLDNIQVQHRQLKQTSSRDTLTQVLTRARILEKLNQLITDANAENRAIAVIMVDIDFFKRINDTHGHLAGDEVLKQVAKRFQTAIRKVDRIGRYGGEEFLILLPDAEIQVAEKIAERVRTHISTSPVNFQDQLIDVTVSEGVAAYQTGESPEALIDRADKALYEAKNAGRNRVVSFSTRIPLNS